MIKIKIGILGCADIARRLVVPNIIASNKYEIIAFASRDKKKALYFSSLFGGEAIEGYENLLDRNDIDAVYIPLPTGMHYEWITKSLQAGKHVFAEKSIATTFKEVQEIIELARRSNLCVFENFMFPYHSQFEFVNKKINEGNIGEIQLLRSSFGFPKFDIENNIRYKKSLGGGAVMDAGAYTVMASQFLLGTNQKLISATTNFSGFEVDFHGTIVLESESKIVSQLAFGFDNFYQNNIELWGTKGKLIIDRAFTAGPGFLPKVIIENQNEKHEYILPADNHFVKILNLFHDAIVCSNFGMQYDQIISQSSLLDQVRNFTSKL
ncbi:Gfo/Idh/MocA family protein [Flavobacterium nackdongense]|uniref:Gfo/Idh/MocA family oxidoreductase n=1 Tax=Flavobacterium nackdongense TaxID=2547394 RepID=A0A4P6YG73_9FLAO|nr:Gfo/Idh/MocA family oxidoreductase [Flavobacterium nackdongense]QBN19795.1 Gfo/Idh/MocA family oxidoreductase [Flavobacterium nackdongense]